MQSFSTRMREEGERIGEQRGKQIGIRSATVVPLAAMAASAVGNVPVPPVPATRRSARVVHNILTMWRFQSIYQPSQLSIVDNTHD
jgi:hypothetical protein